MSEQAAADPRAAVLINAAVLAQLCISAEPPVLLDIRWVAGKVDHQGYLDGHLPGAIFIDLDVELAGQPGIGGRHPLPSAQALQELWRRVGINSGGAVVVYDTRDSSVAARAWWLLRWSGLSNVRVLDGGFQAWASDPGRLVEKGQGSAASPGDVNVQAGGMPVVDDDRASVIARGGGTLLDARAVARFRGEIEPLDPIAGHIPGAVNLPLTELLTTDGHFLDHQQIRGRFESILGPAGSVEAGEVAASCGSGVTACHLILAAATIGRQIALYPGSYSGWLALGRPVAVGSGGEWTVDGTAVDTR